MCGRPLYAAVCSVLILASYVSAQNVAPAPSLPVERLAGEAPSASWTFDVVSIRPSDPKDDNWTFQVAHPSGRFRSINRPIGEVILMAYLPISLWDKDRVLGGQAWIWKEKYDFVGKVAASDLPEWQWRSKNWGPSVVNPMLQVMLQAALKERCKMEAHTIPAEVNGFALVAGNHGPNFSVLIRTKDGEGIPIEAQKMPENGRMIPYSRGSETPTVHFYQTSMKSFAAVLSEWGAPVEDRTGLDGIYDFPLEKFYDGDEPDRDWDIRSLGLKLVPIKVPSVKIVIDHIEPPTPN